MRSHFLPPPKTTAACALAGAASLLHGACSAQSLVAADYATNPVYTNGWTAGQNGGYGFGPWSFDGTDTNPAGQYQGMSSSSAIGTAWTLATYAEHSGLANAGRAIAEPGGLQPGQTLEIVLQNPTGYHFYRGFDICCLNSTNNNAGGINTAALRTQVFAYYVKPPAWTIGDFAGSTGTPLDIDTTAASGMKYDLTLTSTNTYSVTLTPLSNPSAAYNQAGTLNASLPITWVNFRSYWGTSTGIDDPADNFQISSMTISGVSLNIQGAGSNVVLSWSANVPGFNLLSAPSLAGTPVWTPVSTIPVVVNGQNYVTNPIAGGQQFFRLQFQQ